MVELLEALKRVASLIHSEDQKKLGSFVGNILNALLIRAMVFATFVFGLGLLYRRFTKGPHRGPSLSSENGFLEVLWVGFGLWRLQQILEAFIIIDGGEWVQSMLVWHPKKTAPLHVNGNFIEALPDLT